MDQVLQVLDLLRPENPTDASGGWKSTGSGRSAGGPREGGEDDHLRMVSPRMGCRATSFLELLEAFGRCLSVCNRLEHGSAVPS